jgi:hypothetical protein
MPSDLQTPTPTSEGVSPQELRAAVADAIRRRLVGPVPGATARKIAELLGPAVTDALVFSSVSGDPTRGLARLEP